MLSLAFFNSFPMDFPYKTACSIISVVVLGLIAIVLIVVTPLPLGFANRIVTEKLIRGFVALNPSSILSHLKEGGFQLLNLGSLLLARVVDCVMLEYRDALVAMHSQPQASYGLNQAFTASLNTLQA
jgi:hypothetical protein